jgi:hypothetical protein
MTEKTWCPTCKKPVAVSLDCFPALCGDCRQPYLTEQMTTWRRRNDVLSAMVLARDALHACLRHINEHGVADRGADEAVLAIIRASLADLRGMIP